MKLKTRLIVAFITVAILPVILATLFILLVGRYQLSAIEKTYEISGTSVQTLSNPMRMLGQLTVQSYKDLSRTALVSPKKLEDATFLEKFNNELKRK